MSSRTERDAERYLAHVEEGHLPPVDLDLYIAVTKGAGHRRKNIIDMPARLAAEETAGSCVDYLFTRRLERVRELVTPGREIVQGLARNSTICYAWLGLYLDGKIDWREAVEAAFDATMEEISRLSEELDAGARTPPAKPESTYELVRLLDSLDLVRREYVRLAVRAMATKE